MKDNVLFLNMFALYQPAEGTAKFLEGAVIRSAELDPVERRIELELSCAGPVPGAVQAEICRSIERIYGLKALVVQFCFQPENLYQMEPGDLTWLFVQETPMNMGSLAGAAWEW